MKSSLKKTGQQFESQEDSSPEPVSQFNMVDLSPQPVPSPRPVLQRQWNCGFGGYINIPRQIVAMPNGSAVVMDTYQHNVAKYNVGGDIQRDVISRDPKERIAQVSVYDGHVFYIDTSGKHVWEAKAGEPDHEVLKLTRPIRDPLGLVVREDAMIIMDKNRIQRCSRMTDKQTVIVRGVSFNFMTGAFINGSDTYIVSDGAEESMLMYDEHGQLLNIFGSRGSGDGQFKGPKDAEVMMNGNILVADWAGQKIQEFGPDGSFLCDLLTRDDGLCGPIGLAYYPPYLWVIEAFLGLFGNKCVKLFKFPDSL